MVHSLTSFKLFAGESNNAWQIHLRAATDLFQQGCGARLKVSTQSFHTGLDPDVPLTDVRAAAAQDSITFKFAGATITWLDIVSSVSAGTAPKLLSFHYRSIADDSWTKLHEIMGCRNWAMRVIGRVAGLQALKEKSSQGDPPDLEAFDEEVVRIKEELRVGFAQEEFEKLDTPNEGIAGYQPKVCIDTTLITHLFAKSASIYLHLITHGFQQIHPQEANVSDVLHFIHTQLPTYLLPASVLPLYIIACAAKKGYEQDFCRNIFSSAPILDPFFKHRNRILPILEEVWRRRENVCGLSWRNILDLTGDILLL